MPRRRPLAPRDLLDRRFRSSAGFRVARLAELDDSQLGVLGDPLSGPSVAFVLIPLATGLSAKGVDRETADLLSVMSKPAVLPASYRAVFATDPAALQRLVLDSILEVEDGEVFVAGPAAASLVGLPLPIPPPPGRASRLSTDALDYAAALALLDAPVVSARLYQYNREPRSPEWTRRIPSPAALERWLGLTDGAALRRAVRSGWEGPRRLVDNPDWLYFRRAGAKSRRLKLYVAPASRVLPEVLSEIVAAFEDGGIGAFKIAATLGGILRPDKLVAYAESFEQVDETAARIVRYLAGLEPQPVPFTVLLDGDGLTSWGIDPPASERVSKWQGPSWRRWMTDRLAVALVAGTAAGVPSPSVYARQRIALEGVNPATWEPAAWTAGRSERT